MIISLLVIWWMSFLTLPDPYDHPAALITYEYPSSIWILSLPWNLQLSMTIEPLQWSLIGRHRSLGSSGGASSDVVNNHVQDTRHMCSKLKAKVRVYPDRANSCLLEAHENNFKHTALNRVPRCFYNSYVCTSESKAGSIRYELLQFINLPGYTISWISGKTEILNESNRRPMEVCGWQVSMHIMSIGCMDPIWWAVNYFPLVWPAQFI